jgi:lysophospholipase L1-like esterase
MKRTAREARLILAVLTPSLCAQIVAQRTPAPQAQAMLGQKEAEQLATRMLQLMESTATAVPGLIRASEPVKQNAELTFTAMQRTPQNPALTYQFMNQIKAYLALSESIPRPYPFPPAADQQYSELREDLQRMQQHFEAILQVQNLVEQKVDTDPNNLKRYADADSKMLPATSVPRVVFLGDSITEGWRLNEYFTGRDFVNRGIGDQTTLQMLARFRQDVASLNPKVVVILGGSNDIAAGVSFNQIEDNLTMIGELAKVHGIKAVFASILPVSDYHKDADPRYERTKNRPPSTIQAINQWMQGHCQSEGQVYMDYYSAMIDSAGRMQADLSDDGLHPNAKGYRVMSPVALEAIGRILSGQSSGPEESQSGKRRLRLPGK